MARGAQYIDPVSVFAANLNLQFRQLTGRDLPPDAFEKGLAEYRTLKAVGAFRALWCGGVSSGFHSADGRRGRSGVPPPSAPGRPGRPPAPGGPPAPGPRPPGGPPP
ncbi:MAG: hypothetical protein ACK5YO_28730, partial [Planctomyces sp.]